MPGKQVWFTPSRVRISLPPPTLEEVRHRRGHRPESSWRTAKLQVLPVVGAIPTSSAIFDVAVVRYSSDEDSMAHSCAFCERHVPTRGHHVVPRCKGGTEILPTCHSCEDFIHKTWSHNELRDTFNTVESILADARFQKFFKWLHKQQDMAVFRSQRGRMRRPGKYR